MPGGDRTGPEGYGPRSGRGFGYCSGYDSPGYTKGVPRGGRGFGGGFGRGYGWGRGRGYGYRWRSFPYYWDNPDQYPSVPYPQRDKNDKTYLENLIKELEGELSSLRDRLKNLTKKKEEETP